MKVALVYDRVNTWGGAERVLLALKELFPNAPLYTSIYSHQRAGWARVFDVRTSFLQHMPYATGHHEFFAPFMPIAFEQFNFDEYDVVISVTSEAAKGIIVKPHTLHICYCLTPTRYLWSGYEEYFKNPYLKIVSKPVVSYLKKWDIMASARPDFYIAISNEVKKRIAKYYNQDSIVVYPGVELNSQIIDTASADAQISKPFFLVVSRLIEFKRIDVAIEACNKLKIPLKIVGGGPFESYLKSIASSYVEFLGNLTDKDLIQYYKGSLALISPAWEDLGLTSIEAQSFGKPVIAYGKGGARETIAEGKTGLFFEKQETQSLIKTLNEFLNTQFDPEACKKQAQKFGKEQFKESFLKAIKKMIATHKKI